MMFYYILLCSWNLLAKLFYVLTVNNGSRKIAPSALILTLTLNQTLTLTGGQFSGHRK